MEFALFFSNTLTKPGEDKGKKNEIELVSAVADDRNEAQYEQNRWIKQRSAAKQKRYREPD
jgi:hypothetical protein